MAQGKRLTRGEAPARLWRAMRMQKSFQAREIAALCDVSARTCVAFIGRLWHAEYLRDEGGSSKSRVYTLVRDTGPMPPRFARRGATVTDTNEEIERERRRELKLLADLRRCQKRLQQLGAYVEREKEDRG